MIPGRRLSAGAAFAAALLLILLAVLSVEYKRRSGLYWYDVNDDYAYAFRGSDVLRLPVEMTGDGFSLPVPGDATISAFDSAFVGLRVSAGPGGHWFEPSIEVRSGDGPARRQFFERGARGLRYLNITPEPGRLFAPGEKITLRGRHIRWSGEAAEVVLFRTPLAGKDRVLILAPHPDDAEIAAFGVYAGHDSIVATITPGNYADAAYAHLLDGHEAADRLRAELRTWDSLAVPLWAGVEADRIVNLGYASMTLASLHGRRQGVDFDDSNGEESFALYRRGNVAGLLGSGVPRHSWGSLVADLASLIELGRPDVIVAPHPALDANTDHQFTTIALMEALDLLGDAQTPLLLYTNHHVHAEYFPFGPADSVVSLPPWFDPGLPLSGVASFALDEDLQVRKLFALDAMHDLRDPPRRLTGGPTGRFFDRARRTLTALLRDPVESYSYYRRAPRPNELFFVYAPADRARLVEYSAQHVASPRGAATP